jgi:hypothetical protein
VPGRGRGRGRGRKDAPPAAQLGLFTPRNGNWWLWTWKDRARAQELLCGTPRELLEHLELGR